MITALARAARRHLSSPTTTSVDETVQLLNLIDEKSNYLRDSIDGLASELRPRLHAAAIPDRAAPTDAGRPAAAFVDADEFDQHVEALKEIRVLAEAGTAFVSHYYAESAEHKESGYLFAALAARAMAAGEELDKTVAHLVQLAGQKRGGVQ